MNEIKCTVTNCVHHCGSCSCDAKEISVGKSEKKEKICDCRQTECESFQAKA